MAQSQVEEAPSEHAEEEWPDVHASQVYVLMKKHQRVSRNVRAWWFFEHLKKSIVFTPPDSIADLKVKGELKLVSVIPHDPEVKLQKKHTYRVHIGPDTTITFLSWRYRLSFTLDLSPSLMSVDIHNGQYVFDGVYQSLSRCLKGLVMPFPIPGSDIWFSPDLYISVICQTPVVCSSTNQALIQGVRLTQENLDCYLRHIDFELRQFEAALSVSFAKLLKLHRRKQEPFFLDGGDDEPETVFNLGDHIGCPDAAFTNLLRYGILSLQLLPENSSSGIVVITDGIVGLSTSAYMELLLNQLRNNTIMCSFIKVGSPSGLYRKLAHVPHIELMQALATATFGSYLGSGPDVSEEENEANLYHRAMLFWTFQRGLEGFKYELTHYSDEDMPGSISWIKKMLYRHPITGDPFGIESLRKERDKRTVIAGLHSVLSVRLREGYTIKNVCFMKDDTEILVKLHFPWHDLGRIEYAASATWPLDQSNPITQIEVAVEGSYDLLHEMLCKPNEKKSSLRMNNLKTLWTILEKIAVTDNMLEHLQAFSSQPAYYSTPESIRSGVPLFYMQQDGPSINMQLKGSSIDQFASYWKAVIQLDTNTWQKWFHSHRIGLVLEHDRQFPKCFQVPNASSRFASIQCRQALTSLSLLLREWSTFVLAENHSYIKFLQQEAEKPPQFFCVLRVTSKAPNMIIRLGFLGGTPAWLREEELALLREKISNLRFPPRGSQKSPRKMIHASSATGEELVKKPHKAPLNKEGSEIACCVLLTKPVEKILVIYESKPKDMLVVKEPFKDYSPRQVQDPMKSVFRTLTHYLQHQRWVWNIQANSKAAVSMTAISRMLATITKMRLQEGFHFAVSGAGVTNLVLEVEMKETENADENDPSCLQTCVVQYIIFPPHTKTVDDSLSEDDQEDIDATEADREVQIVTECWVEPQYGICCNNTPERQHFNGLTYLDIAKTFFPFDYECVSSLATFEHLAYLCQNSASTSPDAVPSRQSSPPSTPGHRLTGKKDESVRSEPTVNFISFPFDLLSLLPQSQQAELLFSSFTMKDGSRNSQDVDLDQKEPNELLFSLMFDKLKQTHNNEILISMEDCCRFMQHLVHRPRSQDAKQLPFTYRPDDILFTTDGPQSNTFFKETERETAQESTTQRRHRSGGSDVTSDHNSPRLGPDDQGSRLLYNKHKLPSEFSESPNSSGYFPSFKSYIKGELSSQPKPKGPDMQLSPRWKCFVKMDMEEHLLMTMVPASFDDLILLNPGPTEENANGPESSGFSLDPLAVPEDVMSQSATSDNLSKKQTSVKDESTSNMTKSTQSQKASDTSLTVTSDMTNDAREGPAADPSESQREKVQEWVNTSTQTMKPHLSGPLPIPVYVYSCQLKNVTESLIDRWNFQMPQDIYEDLTFSAPEGETTDIKLSPRSPRSPRSPESLLQSFDATESAGRSDERDSWRNSLDRRSTDSTSYVVDSFKDHCKALSEYFFNSFVTGVFLSLQQSYFIDSLDVDAAINNICEESHPLESDITQYLLASCSHMQGLVEIARHKERQEAAAKAAGARSQGQSNGGQTVMKQVSVRFQDMPTYVKEEVFKIPESLQLPCQCVDIPEEDCEQPCQQLREDLATKFANAIGKSFRPVPTLPDFFFYFPAMTQIAEDDDVKFEDGVDAEGSSNEQDGKQDDKADMPEEDQDEATKQISGSDFSPEGMSMDSNHDTSSLDSLDENIFSSPGDADPMPLFVHFICTIKQKSNFQHIAVRNVPQCFAEIIKNLEEPLKSLDFGDLQITFDIICLTLPHDVDQAAGMVQRPSFVRQMSTLSQRSDDGHRDSDIIKSPVPISDPICHLMKPQHQAVYSIKDEVEAVMQEEVISSLRQIYPITVETLSFVADFISSKSSRTAQYQIIKLIFVYGPDQSLNMFIEEFERQSLPGFRITKEGDFYFLVVNKALAHQLRYEQQLKYAASNLHLAIQDSRRGSNEEGEGICKEDRSFSLPCIFLTTAQAQMLRQSALDLIQSTNQDGTPTCHLEKPRPRSRSDTKFHKRPSLSPLQRSQIDVKPETAVSSPREREPTGQMIESRIHEENGEKENSLKKSYSFAQIRPVGTPGSTVRIRHRSAPSGRASSTTRSSILPNSPLVISSRESTTDDGFDGDVSDMELDETASVSDISACHLELPDFWLLIKIHPDKTEVFFHSREAVDGESPASMRYQELYSRATNNINQVCRKVNQILLLKELNKTKMCNALLVPEADEDHTWTSRRTLSGRSVQDGYENDEEEGSEEGQNQGYLAASMIYVPGWFACDVVWRHRFPLHPRLKSGMQRGGLSMGVIVLRGVLSNFLVTNRKNMFVIEELSSRNVFYLRLTELQFDTGNNFDAEASADAAQSSQWKNEMNRTDSDSISLTSSIGRQTSRTEEIVEITVHGVEEVGKEIKDDLMKMLQNKLDDALLDAICVMLSRNPQCKLKPDDIYFIQKPRSEASLTLQLTIPGHCSMYLVALMYYLRQNLLQFLSTPNYVDTNPACQFQDLIDDVWTAIPSDKVYLYIRPQPGGGKGIACISVDLVDGQGRGVKLLHSPSPTKNNSLSMVDEGEFDRLVHIAVHERSSTSFKPGPTALVQFRVWECGNCDLKMLQERLMGAVRHALCDIVMEYFLLTSPICSVPRNLLDISAQPVSSLPASPIKTPAEGQERRHNPLVRKMSIDPPKSVTHTFSMFSSFGDLRAGAQGTPEAVAKCLDFSSSQAPTDPTLAATISRSPLWTSSKGIPTAGPKDGGSSSETRFIQQSIAKYECGEKGSLHPIFCSLIEPWLLFCYDNGVPSVSKAKFRFESRFSVDFVIKELLQSVPSISAEMSVKVFKVLNTNLPAQPAYGIAYAPCRRKAQDVPLLKNLEETTVNLGDSLTLMAIGRNMDQWHTIVQDHMDVKPTISQSTLRAYRSTQKFLPQVPVVGDVKSQGVRGAEDDFVPRQKLLVIICKGKKLTLLMYNWSSDLTAQMEKTVTRLIQWNNARSHVLDSIIAQKMGLFRHFAFSDLQHTLNQNPFTQSSAEVDSLIRYHAPSRDYQRRHSSLSAKERERHYPRTLKRIIPFDQTYKNMPPPKLLDRLTVNSASDPVLRHSSGGSKQGGMSVPEKPPSVPSQQRENTMEEKVPLISIRDPVFQQGMHFHETRKALVEEDESSKLCQLYIGWSATNWKTDANPPVFEDYLIQLKRAGRLFHYCATPLVFSATWRHNVVHKTTARADRNTEAVLKPQKLSASGASSNTATPTPASAMTGPGTPDKTHRTRSRHSSGASVVSVKAKSSEESSRKGSESAGGGRGRAKKDEEEGWHIALRRKFIREYKDYLVSELGFIALNVQFSNLRKAAHGPTSHEPSEFQDSRSMTINLQKTLTGGIILMELSFRQEFFVVKMFAVDCCQLRVLVNKQIHLIFLDECDKYKDLIHVHSFAHDFHLRSVQRYLDNREEDATLFPEGFDLDSFLMEFKQIYPYPPSFSRNCLLQDSLVLSDLPFPGQMLYNYMLKQMGIQDMKVFRMGDKFSLVDTEDFPLTSLEQHTENDPRQQPDIYDACLIISNWSKAVSPDDPMKLVLKYNTVLTRRQDCYPIRMLEKAFGEFRGHKSSSGGGKKPSVSSESDKLEDVDDMPVNKPVAVKQHIGMRQEHVNYRGYSNAQHLLLQSALKKQTERGREKILAMVEMSKKKCRRDYLWQRLLTNSVESNIRGHRSDTDQTLDSTLSPLSSTEFCELLEKVSRTPLSQVDPQLAPLSDMPVSWYKGLFSTLTNKYPRANRCYSSTDGLTQYIVVLNSNNLDMFAMLALNESTGKSELCVVMKEPPVDAVMHSPETPNLQLYSFHTHVEDVVNVCLYHMWASMLV